MIESVKLFDIYAGNKIPKGRKSLAFSICYRSEERTLTAEDVNELHSRILNKLQDSLRAELRS
jgi:phenylalanyl-tRNA synthetase beta chain